MGKRSLSKIDPGEDDPFAYIDQHVENMVKRRTEVKMGEEEAEARMRAQRVSEFDVGYKRMSELLESEVPNMMCDLGNTASFKLESFPTISRATLSSALELCADFDICTGLTDPLHHIHVAKSTQERKDIVLPRLDYIRDHHHVFGITAYAAGAAVCFHEFMKRFRKTYIHGMTWKNEVNCIVFSLN